MAKATCYLQVEPTFNYNGTRVYGLTVRRVTSKKPSSPLPGVVVTKLVLNIPDEAFLPLAPEAEVTIPLSHTEPVTVESEPLAVVPS